jgi:hypothetical protein
MWLPWVDTVPVFSSYRVMRKQKSRTGQWLMYLKKKKEEEEEGRWVWRYKM